MAVDASIFLWTKCHLLTHQFIHLLAVFTFCCLWACDGTGTEISCPIIVNSDDFYLASRCSQRHTLKFSEDFVHTISLICSHDFVLRTIMPPILSHNCSNVESPAVISGSLSSTTRNTFTAPACPPPDTPRSRRVARSWRVGWICTSPIPQPPPPINPLPRMRPSPPTAGLHYFSLF